MKNTTLQIPASTGVLANDFDVEHDTLSVISKTNPSHGTVTVAANGGLTYTPTTNYTGADSFRYTISDGKGKTATATVNINVKLATNSTPVAANDTIATAEDTATNKTLPTGTDADSGQTLTYAISTPPAHGTITGLNTSTGAYTYTPATNYNGADAFNYVVSDGIAYSAPATVTITVTAVNDAPIASNGSFSTAEDTAATKTLPAGTDVEGQALTYAVSTPPAHGTITGLNTTTGAYTYTPAANYNGADNFKYVVSDGVATSAPATVSITVTAVNDAPVASAGSFSTAEDTATNKTLPAGTDVEGQTLTYAISTPPAHGTITGFVAATGAYTYNPATNYNGTDTFNYTVSDGVATSTPATITITVTAVNDAPVASNASFSTAEDTAATKTLPGTDVDNASLTYAISTPPAHGTITGFVAATGAYTYTPATNYSGQDSLSYTVSDGTAISAPATVSITVTAVNDAPVASAGSFSTAEDTATNKTLPAGTDVEGQTLTYAISTPPTHGTITNLNATTGAYTYTPATNYNGTDTFVYVASDGTATSAPAAITITVTAVNDAPVASNASFSTAEDTAATKTLPGTDVDNASLTYAITTPPAHGTITNLNTATGAYTYTPATNYNGPDSLNYTVSDGVATSTPATITITVTAVNDAPAASNGSFSTAEDTAATKTLPAGTDVEGQTLTYAISTPPAHGTITNLNTTTGAYTYSPATNYNGPDALSYTVSDGVATSAPATVTITVTAVNDAPAASNGSFSTAEDTAATKTLPGTDVDNASLTYAISTPPAHGTITGFNITTGAYTYTPATITAGRIVLLHRLRRCSYEHPGHHHHHRHRGQRRPGGQCGQLHHR